MAEKAATSGNPLGRYATWRSEASKAACLAFDGPAFRGLKASAFSSAEQKRAQKGLRILCALYGVLKPYDAIRFGACRW